MYVESFYQRPATAVTVRASPHPVVSVKISAENHFAKVDRKSREVEVKGLEGGCKC